MLGLEDTSPTLNETTNAYQRLNQLYNPANNPDPANLKRFKAIQEAYDCLRITPCKSQYKKFGNYIQSLGGEQGSGQPNDPINSTDWRVAGSLLFYITYALLAAAMSTVEVIIQSRNSDCLCSKRTVCDIHLLSQLFSA